MRTSLNGGYEEPFPLIVMTKMAAVGSVRHVLTANSVAKT